MPRTTDQLTRISKFLSLHLRHQPERLGLTLGPGGWVAVDDLLRGAQQRGFSISRDELDAVVRENDKQRFSLDASGTLIRANQGHSVEIDLQLAPLAPPVVLYHGTGEKSVGAIEREGLLKMQRHHVHLSADVETARKVGGRHGRPVIFRVDTATMERDGFLFYRSENGVWLVDSVPTRYLAVLASIS
ncbi:MAG: RNA 2'-phosphotransferase [Chloroflexota bacterium]